MIENHTTFHFEGQVVHQDMVLFCFREGVYAHRLPQAPGLPALQGQGATDNPARQQVRAQLAATPCGGWMEGWHPAPDGQTWGNAMADQVLDRCNLDELPALGWRGFPFDIRPEVTGGLIKPYHAGADMVFVWHVQPAPTRIVVMPRPMLTHADPGFYFPCNEAVARSVLAQGVLAPNRHCIEIRGADSFKLQGYQIEKPGEPPNLFFRGGVLIQTHADAMLKGFHPWPDSFCAVLPGGEKIDRIAGLLQDPEFSRATMLDLMDMNLGDVPPGFCKVMVDRVEEGFRVTPLPGYVPLALPDGKPNPGADPAITPGAARTALAASPYAIEVDPRRVTRPPRFDAGSNWEIDEIAAVLKAFYCNIAQSPIPNGIGHDYLMDPVEEYLHDPHISAMLKQVGITSAAVEKALDTFRADRSMREWMLLRLDMPDLLAMIAKYHLKVAGTARLNGHPAPFKNGEFKNAIVVATDPPDFDRSARFGTVAAAGKVAEARHAARYSPTFNALALHSLDPGYAKPRTTTMYFTPQGECLVPGSMARELKHQVKVRAHPLHDGGWGEVDVIQL